MEQYLKRFIEITKRISPKSFITSDNEIIVETKNNIYFRLDGIQNEMEFKCKVIAWLSRPSCKGISNYWQVRIRAIVNEFLGTSFTKDEMSCIYTYLGNDCNRPLCVNFIESNYDFTIFPLGYDPYKYA